MKKTTRKFLNIILSLLLVCQNLPATYVWADEVPGARRAIIAEQGDPTEDPLLTSDGEGEIPSEPETPQASPVPTTVPAPTEPAAADPSNTDPVPEPTKAAEPTGTVDPTKAVQPTGSPEPTKAAEPTGTAEPTKAADPGKNNDDKNNDNKNNADKNNADKNNADKKDDSDKKDEPDKEEDASAITDVKTQNVSYHLIWNDNNNEAFVRPAANTFQDVLRWSIDGGLTWTHVSENLELWKNLCGEDADLPRLTVSEDNFNSWTLSAVLPVSYKEEDTEKTILWSFHTPETEALAADSYLFSWRENDRELKLTLKEDFHATIRWEDNSNTYGTRPQLTSDDFVVYRYPAYNSELKTIVSGDLLDIAAIGDSYVLKLKDQPSFDENGYDYQYIIQVRKNEGGEERIAAVNSGYYKPVYENIDNNASDISDLCADGILTLTLNDETIVSVNKVWHDDGETERPSCTMYLYRVVEGDNGTVTEEQVRQASPVQNFDSVAVPTDADVIEVVFTSGSGIEVPMYDLSGHRYVYFAMETGLTGDYVRVIDNSASGYSEEIIDLFKQKNLSKYVLNGGTILNTTDGSISQEPAKVFQALAMQNMTAKVRMELQVKNADGSWESASSRYLIDQSSENLDQWVDENGIVRVVLDGFCSESKGDRVDGPGLMKYDPVTKRITEYRWVETALAVNGGEFAQIVISDDTGAVPVYAEAAVGLHGPGVNGVPTTARFQPVQLDKNTVENTLIGDTQVVIDKTWSVNGVNISAMSEYTYEVDGVEKKIDVSALTATYNLYRDGELVSDTDAGGKAVNPIVLTAADLKSDQGIWEKVLSGLPRYDAKGREYRYSVEETPVPGWGIYVNSVSSVVSDGTYDITQMKYSYVNTIGPGDALYFDISKEWLDDGDLLTRVPVEVGVYRLIKGEDGTVIGCEDTPAATGILGTSNAWSSRLTVVLGGDTLGDTVNDYVVKEISVGGVLVQQIVSDSALKSIETSASGKAGRYSDERIVGIVDEGDTYQSIHYVYDNFVTKISGGSGKVARYEVANRRTGNLSVTMTKRWVAGSVDLELLTGSFELRRSLEGSSDTVLVQSFKLPDTSADPNIEITSDEASEYTITFRELVKYDGMGRQYEYSIVETRIGNVELKEDESGYRIASVMGDNYVSRVYRSSRQIVGKEGHHSGDLYTWKATNSRVKSDDITVYKVWRDDGTAKNLTARPDVYFNLYRYVITDEDYNEVKAGSDFASYYEQNKDSLKVESLGGDRMWNTRHSDWCWSCDTGSWPLFDSNGYHYIYFVREGYQKGSGEYYKFYDNQTGSSARPNTQPVNSTREVLAVPEEDLDDESGILIVLDGSKTVYADTVVNTRKNIRTVSGKKNWSLPTGWTLPPSEMPAIKVSLYASAKELELTQYDPESFAELVESGELTPVNQVTLENGATTFRFSEDDSDPARPLQKYNDYGETVYYYVNEQMLDPNSNFEGTIILTGINNFSIRNTYVFAPPYVEIAIDKTWQHDRSGSPADQAPAAFELYAQAIDTEGNPVGSVNLMSTAVLEGGQTSFTFDRFTAVVNSNAATNPDYTAADYEKLPYYGPNGREMVYFVKEVGIPNGTVSSMTSSAGDSASNPVALTMGDDELYSGSAAFTNDYTGGNTSFTATKNWADGSNIPSVSQENAAFRPEELTLSVYRKWNSTVVNGIAMDGGDQFYQDCTVSGTGTSWSIQLKDLAMYAENGQKYTYYVDHETYPEDYPQAKRDRYTTVKAGNGIRNTLDTVSVRATKSWINDETGTVMTQEQLNDLHKLGFLPDTMTFTLQRSTDGSIWTDLNTKEYSYTSYNSADHTWTGLPRYASDAETAYQYRVLETIGDVELLASPASDVGGEAAGVLTRVDNGRVYSGETPSVTGSWSGNVYTNAFTNTVDFRNYTIRKVWEDHDNRDATRPSAITVEIGQTGSTEKLRFTVNKPSAAGNTWSRTDILLPAVAAGVDSNAVYSALDSVSGYTLTSSVWNAAGDQVTLTNTITDESRKQASMTASKVFIGDSGWKANVRPIIRFALEYREQGGSSWIVVTNANRSNVVADDLAFEPVKTVQIGDSNTGSVSWTGMYRYFSNPAEAGTPEEIHYRVTEQMGYMNNGIFTALTAANAPYTSSEGSVTSQISGQNVNYSQTITNTLKTTSVSVHKTWDDDDDRDAIRPESVTVHLLANGTEVDSTILTADDWADTFTGLPVYDNTGAEISYTFSEDEVVVIGTDTGYTAEFNGSEIINRHTPDKVSVSGSKTWNDDSASDGMRPDQIIIRLYANGTEQDSAIVTAEDDWAWSFNGLNKRENGEEITYTIGEDPVSHYTSEVDGYDVINTEVVEVAGSKTWEDKDNADEYRPGTIMVHLFANGREIDSASVTAEDSWSWSFPDLPKYDEDGVIAYTISEDPNPHYKAEIDGYDITNIEVIELEGTKVWKDKEAADGLRPDEIMIRLYANGKEVNSAPVTAEDDWTWQFTDLPKYEDGEEIEYSISEDPVDHYISTIDGFTVTNEEVVTIEGKKTWEDDEDRDALRPDQIVIRLFEDGEEIDSKEVTEAEDWSWSFEGLPKYKDDVEIVYTIREDEVENYSSRIDGYNVTNTHVPEETEVSVKKIWEDADNQDGLRPKTLTIHLYADGEDTGKTVVLNADNNWSDTFKGLSANNKGTAIVYTVIEAAVSGYTAKTEGNGTTGFTITNTHVPEKTEITVTKKWEDTDNKDGIRPKSVTVHLYADGKDTGDKLTLNAENKWMAAFTDLNVNNGGKRISYTIKEDAVSGYTSGITGDSEKGYVVTNTHVPTNNGTTGNKTNTGSSTPGSTGYAGVTTNALANVKTGDYFHWIFWILLFILSGTGFFVILFRLRKKNS